jgi:hypothetical protein
LRAPLRRDTVVHWCVLFTAVRRRSHRDESAHRVAMAVFDGHGCAHGGGGERRDARCRRCCAVAARAVAIDSASATNTEPRVSHVEYARSHDVISHSAEERLPVRHPPPRSGEIERPYSPVAITWRAPALRPVPAAGRPKIRTP